MSIAVIGTGKTGKEIVNLLPAAECIGPFNRREPPTVETLKGASAAIVFVPQEAAPTLIPTLLAAKLPTVWGTTGYSWPLSLDEELKNSQICWIVGANFSLGMTLVRRSLKALTSAPALLTQVEFTLSETHHKQKQDSPSGTALLWRDWLNLPDLPITSIRKGDVVGTHELTLSTDEETLTICHTSKNRALFAKGALFAAKLLISGQFAKPGLHKFETVIDETLP